MLALYQYIVDCRSQWQRFQVLALYKLTNYLFYVETAHYYAYINSCDDFPAVSFVVLWNKDLFWSVYDNNNDLIILYTLLRGN